MVGSIVLAFALKNIGFGDGERRNVLDTVRELIILPQSPSQMGCSGRRTTKAKKQNPATVEKSFRKPFSLKER